MRQSERTNRDKGNSEKNVFKGLFKGEYLGHVMALNEPIVLKGIQEKQRKESVAL
jgi:hypothetical protein